MLKLNKCNDVTVQLADFLFMFGVTNVNTNPIINKTNKINYENNH